MALAVEPNHEIPTVPLAVSYYSLPCTFLPPSWRSRATSTIVSLNNNWLSVAHDSLAASLNGFEKASYKPAQWKPVQVPHNWDGYEKVIAACCMATGMDMPGTVKHLHSPKRKRKALFHLFRRCGFLCHCMAQWETGGANMPAAKEPASRLM